MHPEERDLAYLWDILDASQKIRTYTADIQLADYYANRMLQLAIERLLEIVGEASRRLSEPCRRRHPEVPWSSMIGLRNVLAHEYGEIRHDLIWRIATTRIPELIESVTRILQE